MPIDKYKLTRTSVIHTIQVGDIVVYLARPEDGPTDPDKEWRGKVLHVCVDCLLDHVTVESLEPGEEGLTDFVYPQQMLRKEIPKYTSSLSASLPDTSQSS